MKKAINQDEIQLQRTHPLADLVDGWFFRCEETSAGYYEVEGIDGVGRVVSVTGLDADELLTRRITEAKSIKAQTKSSSMKKAPALDLQKPLSGKE